MYKSVLLVINETRWRKILTARKNAPHTDSLVSGCQIRPGVRRLFACHLSSVCLRVCFLTCVFLSVELSTSPNSSSFSCVPFCLSFGLFVCLLMDIPLGLASYPCTCLLCVTAYLSLAVSLSGLSVYLSLHQPVSWSVVLLNLTSLCLFTYLSVCSLICLAAYLLVSVHLSPETASGTRGKRVTDGTDSDRDDDT